MSGWGVGGGGWLVRDISFVVTILRTGVSYFEHGHWPQITPSSSLFGICPMHSNSPGQEPYRITRATLYNHGEIVGRTGSFGNLIPLLVSGILVP